MPGASQLTVEVEEDGVLYPGIVEDIKTDDGSVYLKFEHDWRPENWYACDGSLLEAPSRRSIEQMKERLSIPGVPVQVLYRVKQGAPEAWHRGVVVAEHKGLYAVDLQLTPPRRINVSIEQLRLPQAPTPLALDSICRVQFPVPENAISEATNDRHLAMFAEYGKLDYVRYDPATKNIVVLVYGKAGRHRADILAEMHLNHAVFRQSFRDEIARQRLELFGTENSDHAAAVRSEFRVPPHHLGRVLGFKQENLVRARALPGIVRVSVDYITGHCIVTAIDEASAKPAQAILEFTTDVIYVDQPYVGHVIGKSGCNVQDIIRHSNVCSLNFCDSPEVLHSHGVNYEWRDGFVPLLLMGTRADIDSAKMLIEYHIDHTRDMDEERRRSLPDRRERHHPRGGGGGQLSRQLTDERDSVDHGVAVAGGGGLSVEASPSNEATAVRRESFGNNGGGASASGPRGNEAATVNRAAGSNGNRGPQPPRRVDGGGQGQQGHFHGRREQGPPGPRRFEGPPSSQEDKRNGHAEGAVLPAASKDWPELGGGEGRLSSQAEGQNANKEIPRAAPPHDVVQNGVPNGHPETRGSNNHQAGYGGRGGAVTRGGPGGGGRIRGGGGGRGGYQQRYLDNDEGGGRREMTTKPAHGGDGPAGMTNGQPNGGGRVEDVDGEGFKPVQGRGKRHARHPRGGGHGVANGIRPAPEESVENRREDQVSR